MVGSLLEGAGVGQVVRASMSSILWWYRSVGVRLSPFQRSAAQAESQTRTRVCAALLVSSSEASDRGCPVRCSSYIRSVVEIHALGPGAIFCIAAISVWKAAVGGVSTCAM